MNKRFNLKMRDNTEVNTLDELIRYADEERIISEFKSGMLYKWMYDRFYFDEIMLIEDLNASDANFYMNFCKLLNIDYNTSRARNKLTTADRGEIIVKYSNDRHILNNINKVAFNQDELFDILSDSSNNEIYLLGPSFSIPLGRENMKYIGVNNPQINFRIINVNDFLSKNISFENVRFAKKNSEFMLLVDSIINDNQIDKTLILSEYCSCNFFESMLVDSDKTNSEVFYSKISTEFIKINYDSSAWTRSLKNLIEQIN